VQQEFLSNGNMFKQSANGKMMDCKLSEPNLSKGTLMVQSSFNLECQEAKKLNGYN